MNEKEQVYEEVSNLRRRVFELRKQVRGLHRAHSRSQAVQVQQERDRLKTALSWIGHSPDAPDDAEQLKYAARLALLGTAHSKPQRERNRALAASQAAYPRLRASTNREEPEGV